MDEPVGPGRLVLVVGPSGAGKDALIRASRERFALDARFVFPQRTITRLPSASEDNRSCDPATFASVAEAGGFAVVWAAHGQSYGIPACIRRAIAEGRTVVCNVSRTVVADLRRRYADVLVIAVTAPAAVLADRLASRRRPEDGDVGARLARSDETPDVGADLTIGNAGPLEEALTLFCAALAREGSAHAGRESSWSPGASAG